LIKPRVFRPFPVDELAQALSKFKAVAVMDKADSFNAAGGPLFTEVTSALFTKGVFGPKVINYKFGWVEETLKLMILKLFVRSFWKLQVQAR